MLASSAVISGLVICPVDILKSPAMTTLGGGVCDLYSLVRESRRASRDWW